jgi:AraC-like DNA-binding protein
MTALIAITPDALDAVLQRLERIEAALTTRPPEWLSIDDYAARAGCSRRTVIRRIAAGKLQVKGAGHKRLVRVSPAA